ncbi:MAG TPA: VC0807 family protein [Caulobacteraceae bacterium]|nr:VC0807 family protein [Caulobacteraceae bacterium]
MSAETTSDRSAEPAMLARLAASAREHGPGALVSIAFSFVLPFLIYSTTHRAIGDVHALMAASAPPIARTIFAFARHRRVDALSLIVLAGIALSLIAFFGGGGARSLQLREHLVAAVIGLGFLGSAAIGKPLIYHLASARLRRGPGANLGHFEAASDHPIFRRAMMTMTLAWGFGLVLESAVACVLVVALPISAYLVVSPIWGYGLGGALTAWTFWYARRRVLAARAAADPRR